MPRGGGGFSHSWKDGYLNNLGGGAGGRGVIFFFLVAACSSQFTRNTCRQDVLCGRFSEIEAGGLAGRGGGELFSSLWGFLCLAGCLLRVVLHRILYGSRREFPRLWKTWTSNSVPAGGEVGGGGRKKGLRVAFGVKVLSGYLFWCGGCRRDGNVRPSGVQSHFPRVLLSSRRSCIDGMEYTRRSL